MKLSLTGKRAIVTGGTKGIGLAVAQELVSEGAVVSLCARSVDQFDGPTMGLPAGSAHAYAADVTDSNAVARFVSESARVMGGIDIVVNNAGRAHPGGFEQLRDADWHDDLDVKLFSQIRVTREALPHLRKSVSPRVININAVYGRNPDPAFFATSVDRAACLSLTKVLAQQYGHESILVNSVNIGFVTTPQWHNIHQQRAPELTEDEFFATITAAEVPLKRFGRPDEVSGLVAFLASDRASYITGASIDVAGGMGRYV